MTNGSTKLAAPAADASPPRVLHVITPAAFGGLEQVVLQLATGRAARGFPTEVLALAGMGSDVPPIVEMLMAAGVRTTLARNPHRAYRAEQRAIQSAATAFGANVVHTHGYHPDVLAGRAARNTGSRLVSTAHGFTGGGRKNQFFEWLQRRAWRRFDVVAAVSGPLRTRLLRSGVPPRVVALCPNAWSGAEPLDRSSARDRLGVPPSHRVVGWVGRLSREKGADVIVRAVAHLPPDVGVVMIGNGPQRDELARLAHELGVATRITWAGQVANAGACMAAFDAFALSSRTEGTPMVLFEAMAARVPIAATAVGGVPDVLSARDAVLVPPDDPRALGDALGRLLGDAHAAAALTSAARRRLDESYGLSSWLDRYESFYAGGAHRD